MDFEPCFKVYDLVSVHPKSIKLGQMTTLNVIFHVVVSVYRLVEIWTSSQFPAQFRNGLFSFPFWSSPALAGTDFLGMRRSFVSYSQPIRLKSPWIADFWCWTSWTSPEVPEVAILGADPKERGMPNHFVENFCDCGVTSCHVNENSWLLFVFKRLSYFDFISNF